MSAVSKLESLKESVDAIAKKIGDLQSEGDADEATDEIKEALQELADSLVGCEENLNELADTIGAEIEWDDE